MEQSIEQIVDSLPTSRHKAGDIRPRFKRSRFLLKGSPVLTILVVLGVVTTAVLGGLFFTHMDLRMRGTVTTRGVEVQSIFKWDGALIVSNYTSIPMDISELDAGEYVVVEHLLENCDNGDWLVTFEFGPEMDGIFDDPMNAFYGFSLEITPDVFILSPEESQVIEFNYSLHHEFLDPVVFGYNDTNLMPFNLTVQINQVFYPVANTDEVGCHNSGEAVWWNVVANDVGTAPLLITDVTPPATGTWTLTIEADNTIKCICGISTPEGKYTATYEITDLYGLTAVGVIEITVF